MTRFLYSSSALKDFATCPAKFFLWQTGAERGPSASNLMFGRAFHDLMERYINHCVEAQRFSDVSVLGDLLSESIRATGVTLDAFDELWMLSRQFLSVYKIDLEQTLSRECGIAFDENLDPVEWTDNLEYTSLTNPSEEKGEVMFRMKLDHLLLDPDTLTLRVQDYKSDIFAPSKSAIAEPSSRFNQQARIYAWGAHRGVFPKADVVDVEFLFARHVLYGKPLTRTLNFNREEIDQTQEVLLEKIAHVESTTSFEPRSGDHCAMCSFRTTTCPVRKMTSLEEPVERMRRFLWLDVEREKIREQLKQDVAEFGFDGALGDLRAAFETKEELVPDIERVAKALAAEGIEKPWAVMTFSASAAKRVLEKDTAQRVIAAAYDPEPKVKFNVHQPKDALLALAEGRGIDTTKKTIAQLALALAGVAEEVEFTLEIDPEGIVTVEESIQ